MVHFIRPKNVCDTQLTADLFVELVSRFPGSWKNRQLFAIANAACVEKVWDLVITDTLIFVGSGTADDKRDEISLTTSLHKNSSRAAFNPNLKVWGF